MKARRQLQVRRGIDTIDIAQSYHPDSSPNSSAVLSVTVLADIEDVLAVIRTAALLGKSFKASTSIDLPGGDTIQIEAGDNLSDESLLKMLRSMQSKLCKQGPSQAAAFALEANITAASFLAAGTISVHIRAADSFPKRPTVAR
jgi:hypothetical protein